MNVNRKGETTEQMLIRLENDMVKVFKSEAHLYYENNDYGGLDKLEVLSMIQHYGEPTRLLDWSYSPYISTYFAINLELCSKIAQNGLAY